VTRHAFRVTDRDAEISPLSAETLSDVLSCPYHPDVPLDLEVDSATCSACGRRFFRTTAGLDLRPDELRDGTARWKPGEPGWNPGVLRFFGGASRRRGAAPPEGSLEILDIGCGVHPTGTVNVDVYVPDPLPNNFLLAAADRLPFLAKTFDVVTSRYVIEHLTDPAEFIRRCLRLARREVVIVTDNGDWLGEIALRILGTGRIYHPEHTHKWSVEYLRNLCGRFEDCDSTVKLDTYSDTPVVRLLAWAARGRVLAALLHRDLEARLALRESSPARRS
jgi:SAM-dependent methyltransferase